MALRECQEHGFLRGDECLECGEAGKFLMNDNEMNKLGKLMAGILRHFPERFDLEMDRRGWVDLYALIDVLKQRRRELHWLKAKHFRAIADTDDKGRYEVDGRRIRATYAHSLDVEPDLPTDNIPPELFYPASPEEASILLETGLKPSDRRKVHLSKTAHDADSAGRYRMPEPTILKVEAKRAIDAGIVIGQAGKTVFVCDEVPPEYLSLHDVEAVDGLRSER